MLVHLILLDRRPDDDSARRKSLLAHGVLGMKMRRSQVQNWRLAELFRLFQHDGAVARAESGVHHQGRAVANHNPDVGKADNRVNMLRDAGHRVFGQQHGFLRVTGHCRGQQDRGKNSRPLRNPPIALLRNTRKTECGANLFLIRLKVRAAPFALLRKQHGDMLLRGEV